mmetsp:Transcript_24200/g.57437  ORF Transcript_24200/g.57437 Transcript_24200/m.57437 type:complete len:253 (-) Transcript_24200:410-1168(-)
MWQCTTTSRRDARDVREDPGVPRPPPRCVASSVIADALRSYDAVILASPDARYSCAVRAFAAFREKSPTSSGIATVTDPRPSPPAGRSTDAPVPPSLVRRWSSPVDRTSRPSGRSRSSVFHIPSSPGLMTRGLARTTPAPVPDPRILSTARSSESTSRKSTISSSTRRQARDDDHSSSSCREISSSIIRQMASTWSYVRQRTETLGPSPLASGGRTRPPSAMSPSSSSTTGSSSTTVSRGSDDKSDASACPP